MDEENAANRLTLLCIDLPTLRARANTLTSTPYSPTLESEARSIMELADMLDSNLQEWYQTLPTEWHHRTVGMVHEIPSDVDINEAESWPGPQHAYHDVPVANLINDYRICRILCQIVIMACLTWLSLGDAQSGDETYDRAQFIIQQMVDEIAAGVPFHMSYEMQPVAQELGLEKNGEFIEFPMQYQCLHGLAAEAFGGYSLVWPLYVAANAPTVPQRQQDWLNGRLYVIGTRFGLSSAQVLVLARRHYVSMNL
jgi:hypothetical protein